VSIAVLKAALDHLNIIGDTPLLAQKVLESLAEDTPWIRSITAVLWTSVFALETSESGLGGSELPAFEEVIYHLASVSWLMSPSPAMRCRDRRNDISDSNVIQLICPWKDSKQCLYEKTK
jgi:hypothetical protein